MARYIDADKIITDAIKERKFFMTMLDASKQEIVVKTIYKDLAEFINAQPTAKVEEVVKCQDCKHWYYWGDSKCNSCEIFHTNKLKRDDFCSYGERKDT